jgi:hypothetical protein
VHQDSGPILEHISIVIYKCSSVKSILSAILLSTTSIGVKAALVANLNFLFLGGFFIY